MSVVRNPVQVIHRVVGNLEPIGATMRDNTGAVIDMTGKTVTFRMVNQSGGTVKVDDQAATLDDAANGQVSYTFASGDTDTAGTYAMYFQDNSTPARRWPYDGARFLLKLAAEQN